jgi:hypothetical protein
VRLAPRPVLFADRELLLAELDARLDGDDDSGPRTVVLHGDRGSGKTSLAVEYAHQHLGETQIAWQLAADGGSVLAAGFGELAAQLQATRSLGVRDPVASVHAALAAFPGRWLLVFDNAPDTASVEAFIPPAGHGRVLITSQNQVWPGIPDLDVAVLDPRTAAEFLISRTGDQDGQSARDLASDQELGRLPLVLEQAAAYVKAAGTSLAGYLASFRRLPGPESRGGADGYPDTVVATWALAFERLQQSDPNAVALLRLLACCAPDAVPVGLLLQLRPGLTDQLDPEVASALVPLLKDQRAVQDAVAALGRYSLITSAADGSAWVHRLVQAITSAQMAAELAAAWRQATAAIIEAALPGNAEQPRAWPDYAALLPHALAALSEDSHGMAQIASYLVVSGGYAAGIELQRRVLNARARVLGPQHADTLAARHELAYWTGQAGDAAAARDQFAALLAPRERVSGPDHPDTLAARHELAYWTGQAGDAAAARDQFAAMLPVLQAALGPADPSTLATSASVAYWTGHAGNAAAARDRFAALLPATQLALGPEHPDSLVNRHNLANFTGYAGDAAGARDQFAALLPVRERVLGPEHPDTLAARASLAYWTGHAGDAARARDLCAALLPVRERVLGPEHPDTLATRASLAYWTAHAGDAARARDLYAALLPVRERVLGPEHPDTLATRHQLAYWTAHAGDGAGARDQFAALLPVRERVLGPDHPDTLATRTSLAYLTSSTRALQLPRRWLRRAD